MKFYTLLRVLLVSLFLLSFALYAHPVFAALTPRSGDAYQNRIRTELAVFTDWLATNNVPGYVGEFGWPNNFYGDSDSWNRLARTWLIDADSANLWTTAWSTGTFWTQSYKQLIYKKGTGSIIDTPSSQAATLEAHPPTSNYKRGINVSGGEFGVVSDGSFSNQNPGVLGTNYTYDLASTFTYLASRGYNIVRLPIRWERIQPNLNSALSTTESARLQSFVARAGSAGLGVILDIHNFGEYYLYDASASAGVKRKLGSQQLPQSSFTDLWTRLSTLFQNDSNVLAYDLMNEPNGLPTGYTIGALLADFDSGTNGWVGEGSTSVAQDNTIFNSGTGSLRATKTYGSGAVVSRVNNGQGSSVHDISANGLTLSTYVFVPVSNPGTGWQARLEVQKPDFTYTTGTAANITKGVWTNITLTMSSGLASAMRNIVVQFSGNNVNATASAYVDDVTQGTSQTPISLWDNSSQAALNAIRANGDTKLIMVEGYNFAGVQNWTTNNPTPWITDSANNYRYEAHHYWDSDNSGTYASNYVTELASALSHSYTATGTAAPTGSLSINSGSSSTTSTGVTLTPQAIDDLDIAAWIQMEVSNLSDFSDASWQSYSTTLPWTLASGTGSKTVYVRYMDSAGNVSSTYSSSITYDPNGSSSSSSSSSSSNSSSSSSSAPTCGISVPSSAPTLTAATSKGSNAIVINYTNAGDPFDYYFLELGSSSGNYTLGGGQIAAKGTNSYVINALVPGETYYFRVRGGNACATGPWSNELSATTPETSSNILPITKTSLTTSNEDDSLQPTKAPQKHTSTPTPTPKKKPQGKTYDVNINVVNDSKQPVAGAKVVLHSTPREAVSDSKGVAHFDKVEEGDHKVIIAYNNFTGEESLHLTGNDVKTFNLNVQIKPQNPFLSGPVLFVIGGLVFFVVILLGLLLRSRTKK